MSSFTGRLAKHLGKDFIKTQDFLMTDLDGLSVYLTADPLCLFDWAKQIWTDRVVELNGSV